jgi:hypothetical protein
MKKNPIVVTKDLHPIATALIDHIELIVKNWERGDLAKAVNDARLYAKEASKRIGKRSPNHAIDKLVRASQSLLEANARGEVNGASVDWEDIDSAHQVACDALDTAFRRKPGKSYLLAVAAASNEQH